MTTTT